MPDPETPLPPSGDLPPEPSGGPQETSDLSARFPGPTALPGSTLAASPDAPTGRVDIVLRSDIRHDRTALERASPAAADVLAANSPVPSPSVVAVNADLSALNDLLQQYDLRQVEPTFRRSTPLRTAAEALEVDSGAPTAEMAAAETPAAEAPSHRDSFVTLRFGPGVDVDRVAEALNDLPEVARAVPVHEPRPPQQLPRDPLLGTSAQVAITPNGFEQQWYLFRCQVPPAWESAQGTGVVIADIDFGCRTTHQEIADRLELQHNSYDGSDQVEVGDHIDHGTAVLGLAAAGANAAGMVGVAPNAALWAIKADRSGSGSAQQGDAFANAIDFVREQAALEERRVVINLEVQTEKFGNYESIPAVSAAITDAIAAGLVVCVAAGNGDRDAGVDDQDRPFPATGSILVGATAYAPADNTRAWFSNYGNSITVCAPGDSDHDVSPSAASDSAYHNRFGGTSGATPKVSGTVALMLQANPRLTHEQVRTILTLTGTLPDHEPGKPIGVFLNTAAALATARTTTGALS